jgi:hypothetical protein
LLSLLVYCSLAFVNIFPPLHEIGENMLINYQQWGNKRKEEIAGDVTISDKVGESKKVDDRLGKFKEKMNFLQNLKDMPLRKRRNSGSTIRS